MDDDLYLIIKQKNSLIKENYKLKFEISYLNKKIWDLTQIKISNNILIIKNEDLITKNEDLISKNKDLITKNKDLITRNNDLMSENEDLITRNNNLMSENTDLQYANSDKNKYKIKNEYLKMKLKEETLFKSGTKDYINHLENEISVLKFYKNDCKKHIKTIIELENEIIELENEIKILRVQNKINLLTKKLNN